MFRALRLGAVIGFVAAASACGGRQGSTAAGGTGNTMASGGSPASGAPGSGGEGVAGSGENEGGDTGAGSAGVAGTAGSASGRGGTGGDDGQGGHPGGGRAGDAGGSQAGAPGESECAGPFGEERVVLAMAMNEIAGSPTLPGDELELFFVRRHPKLGVPRRVFRAERGARDASFSEPAQVPELDDVCTEDEERSLSLTRDGLRLYIGCYLGAGMDAPGPLHLARRPNREAPFVLDEMTYGTVGGGAGLAPDELTLTSSSEVDVGGDAPPMSYSRSSPDEPFGDGHTIEGLEEVFLLAPSLASDGLALFGSLAQELVVTTRSNADAPFGTPTVLFAGDRSEVVYGQPELSADCKTLYFVHTDIMDGVAAYSINSASR